MKLTLLYEKMLSRPGRKSKNPAEPETEESEIEKQKKRMQLTVLQMPSMTSHSNMDAPLPMKPWQRLRRQG